MYSVRKLSNNSLSTLSMGSRSNSVPNLHEDYIPIYPLLQHRVHMVNDDGGIRSAPPSPLPTRDDPYDERMLRDSILSQAQIEAKVLAATANWFDETKGKGHSREEQRKLVKRALDMITGDIQQSNIAKDRLNDSRVHRLQKELQDCLDEKARLEQQTINRIPPPPDINPQPMSVPASPTPQQNDPTVPDFTNSNFPDLHPANRLTQPQEISSTSQQQQQPNLSLVPTTNTPPNDVSTSLPHFRLTDLQQRVKDGNYSVGDLTIQDLTVFSNAEFSQIITLATGEDQDRLYQLMHPNTQFEIASIPFRSTWDDLLAIEVGKETKDFTAGEFQMLVRFLVNMKEVLKKSGQQI